MQALGCSKVWPPPRRAPSIILCESSGNGSLPSRLLGHPDLWLLLCYARTPSEDSVSWGGTAWAAACRPQMCLWRRVLHFTQCSATSDELAAQAAEAGANLSGALSSGLIEAFWDQSSTISATLSHNCDFEHAVYTTCCASLPGIPISFPVHISHHSRARGLRGHARSQELRTNQLYLEPSHLRQCKYN